MNKLSFRSTFDPKKESALLKKQVRQICENELRVANNNLIKKSPVGATGQLKDGWSLVTKNFAGEEFLIQLNNNSSNVLNRLEGRSKGKQPPSKALESWVSKVLGVSGKEVQRVAFLVARKIAKQGTERGRKPSKEFDRFLNGQTVPGGEIDQALTRIEIKLKIMKI